MKTEVIKVSNMHCAGCVRNVENALSQIENVIAVKAKLEDSTVNIQYEGGDEMPKIFRETLEEWGYPASQN
jgi:P-type Cu2+ transporter